MLNLHLHLHLHLQLHLHLLLHLHPKVIIADPESRGQCGDSNLGEVGAWVLCSHPTSGNCLDGCVSVDLYLILKSTVS